MPDSYDRSILDLDTPCGDVERLSTYSDAESSVSYSYWTASTMLCGRLKVRGEGRRRVRCTLARRLRRLRPENLRSFKLPWPSQGRANRRRWCGACTQCLSRSRRVR